MTEGTETPPKEGGNGENGESGNGGEPPPTDSLSPEARALVERANREAAEARTSLRAAEQAAKERAEELAELKKQSESDQERVVREAKESGKTEAEEEHSKTVSALERRIATLVIENAAAGKFADPADAVSLLPLDELLAEEDDKERAKKVDAALDKLLKDKPYLAAANGDRKLVTQGQRTKGRGREKSWLRG